MERDAREKTGRSGNEREDGLKALSPSAHGNESHERIIHVTAAAAAKAAATALLTNQVVRRVRVSLPDGRKASFKVDKCVLESGSALCSVVGTRLSSFGVVDDVPEVSVRVAWEEEAPAQQTALSQNQSSPEQEPELLWLVLEPNEPKSHNPSVINVSPTRLDGPTVLQEIPLFLYFGRQTKSETSRLQNIPRELLVEAVREALVLLPPSQLGQGVRVFVSLVDDRQTSQNILPKLQTTEEVQALFETPPSDIERLGLGLDWFGNQALPLLLDEEGELFVDLAGRSLNLKNALDQLNPITYLTTLTIGGGPGTVLALASGDLSSLNMQDIKSEFLVMLAQRRDLDSVTVQSLREICTINELIQLISRRRIGWIFDEICRLACLEVRKRLTRPLRLELVVFGATGAVLGRALAEPGVFRL